MGVEEAAERWQLSSGYIKNLCASNKVIARKIGKTWIILKNQPNPKERNEMNFTVIVTEVPNSPYPTIEKSVQSKKEATTLAKQCVEQYQDHYVYVSFYRAKDGQHGYLNRDGYSITGSNW